MVDLVGRTPLHRVRSLLPDESRVEVWAKLERCNPGGSVKDRPAVMMLFDGIARGALRPGQTILESSSGNTGVALAMFGRALGYPVKICVAASISSELKQLLQAYHAEIVLTDPEQGSDGASAKALELCAADPDRYFAPDQYNNGANVWAHHVSTAPEIWHQTDGRVTHLVATIGTGGTLMGTGQGLRERNPGTQVIGVEPDIAGHGLYGMRHIPSTIRPGILRAEGLDRLVRVGTDAAYRMARMLARTEGLLLGPSSAAALLAAREVACELPEGVVVCVCPDGGTRYLSTPVYRDS